jgi:hypothetical protein
LNTSGEDIATITCHDVKQFYVGQSCCHHPEQTLPSCTADMAGLLDRLSEMEKMEKLKEVPYKWSQSVDRAVSRAASFAFVPYERNIPGLVSNPGEVLNSILNNNTDFQFIYPPDLSTNRGLGIDMNNFITTPFNHSRSVVTNTTWDTFGISLSQTPGERVATFFGNAFVNVFGVTATHHTVGNRHVYGCNPTKTKCTIEAKVTATHIFRVGEGINTDGSLVQTSQTANSLYVGTYYFECTYVDGNWVMDRWTLSQNAETVLFGPNFGTWTAEQAAAAAATAAPQE